MNVFLNILKYGLVVVLVALAMFIIACGCLVLFPSVNIFGLSYVTYDSTPTLKQYDIGQEPFTNNDTILIDSGVFNVDVSIVNTKSITNGATQLSLILERHLNGFAIGDDNDKIVMLLGKEITDGDKKILNLKITQPTRAWLFNNGSTLKVLINKDLFSEKDFVIKTTSGAVTIGGKPVYDKDRNNTTEFMSFKSLSVETDNGEVILGCANYASPITIKQNSGNISALVDLNASATLSQKTGFGNITLQNVGSADESKNLVIDGMFNSTLKVKTIYGDFLGKDINGGNVKIEAITKNSVIANDYADFQIDHIYGDLVYTANEGALNLGRVETKVNIDQKKGIVKIGTLGDNTNNVTHIIKTDRANVEINELCNSINVETVKGNVNITGLPSNNETDPLDPSDVVNSVTINVTSSDGAIKLKKVFGNVIYKCEKGNSSINVEYDTMVGGSTFLNQSGAINILMPYNKNIPMWLRWETNKSAKINLISYESTLKTSMADSNVVMDGTKEKGIRINEATDATAEYLQIATRQGVISVNRQTSAS